MQIYQIFYFGCRMFNFGFYYFGGYSISNIPTKMINFA
jgi:hypothetical protein